MLARELGYHDRHEMYADHSAEWLIEREDEYAVDPWGPERLDLAIGLLCSLTDACHRTKGDPLPPIDYMPHVRACEGEREEKRQTIEEQKQIFAELQKIWPTS